MLKLKSNSGLDGWVQSNSYLHINIFIKKKRSLIFSKNNFLVILFLKHKPNIRNSKFKLVKVK